MELAEIITREAVRDLVARYTWAGDRGRIDDLARCFAPDGVLDVGDEGGRWEGRARIAQEIGAVAERTARAGEAPGPVRHHVSGLIIDDITETSAFARSYFLVTTAIGVDHWGRYRDRCTVEEGRWVFAERVVRLDGRSPASLMA